MRWVSSRRHASEIRKFATIGVVVLPVLTILWVFWMKPPLYLLLGALFGLLPCSILFGALFGALIGVVKFRVKHGFGSNEPESEDPGGHLEMPPIKRTRQFKDNGCSSTYWGDRYPRVW